MFYSQVWRGDGSSNDIFDRERTGVPKKTYVMLQEEPYLTHDTSTISSSTTTTSAESRMKPGLGVRGAVLLLDICSGFGFWLIA